MHICKCISEEKEILLKIQFSKNDTKIIKYKHKLNPNFYEVLKDQDWYNRLV